MFRSHGFIGDLESRRKYPLLELVIKIADYFHVKIDQLARDGMDVPLDIDTIDPAKL